MGELAPSTAGEGSAEDKAAAARRARKKHKKRLARQRAAIATADGADEPAARSVVPAVPSPAASTAAATRQSLLWSLEDAPAPAEGDVERRMLETQLHAAQQALLTAEEELQLARDLERRLLSIAAHLETRLDAVDRHVAALMCVACAKSVRAVLFLPCLHALYCTACAALRAPLAACPSCAAPVAASLPFTLPAP